VTLATELPWYTNQTVNPSVSVKYQIELAKLQYELPMARENVRLAKMGELPGFHGLGKYQVDVYSTMIKKRITYLRRKLSEISKRKSQKPGSEEGAVPLQHSAYRLHLSRKDYPLQQAGPGNPCLRETASSLPSPPRHGGWC
jgi:hypothetical protein